MGRKLGPLHKRARIAFFGSHGRLVREIDRRMREAGVVPLDVYDVLLTLEVAPEQRRKMSELAQYLSLSMSGATRAVDRLVREGMIEREPCPEDRRAVFARVTDKGISERERAWPVYEAAILELFAANVSQEEAEVLSAVLGRMAPKWGLFND